MSDRFDHRLVETLAVRTPVEVRNRFNGAWAGGFEVAGSSGAGYWLRRQSDRSLIPTVFLGDDVRPEARPPTSEIDLRTGRTSR